MRNSPLCARLARRVVPPQPDYTKPPRTMTQEFREHFRLTVQARRLFAELPVEERTGVLRGRTCFTPLDDAFPL